MKKKTHAFKPALDGKLEDRLVLNGARASAVLLAAHNHNGGGNGWGQRQQAFPKAAVLTTRTYNQVLVNIHRATENFGRSHGTQADYNRLSHDIGRQLNRIPYARANGLTDGIQGALPYYQPQESGELYGDIRSELVGYLSGEVLGLQVGIRKSPGNYFSDHDIWGPNALIFQGGGDGGELV